MRNYLHSHSCKRCNRSYYSVESEKIYCSSSCECRDKYEKLYPSQKVEKKPKIYVDSKKKVIDEKERWLNKKPLSDRPRQSLKHIMYKDTFKKYIPKSLRVMRG